MDYQILTISPDNTYFHWLNAVQLTNFRRFKLEDKAIIAWTYDQNVGPSPTIVKMATKTNATFLFYPDTRLKKHYVPSIRQHIIKKLVVDHPFKMPVLFMDSDVIYLQKPDMSFAINQQATNICFGSGCVQSYIGTEYLLQFGDDTIQKMADIIGIEPQTIHENNNSVCGAQWVLKNINSPKLWNKIEHDGVALFDMMGNIKNDQGHKIQAWTAEMWSLLWNFWLYGYETTAWGYLDFLWATDKIENTNNNTFLHMAGATKETSGKIFYKGAFTESCPFNENFSYIEKDSITQQYVKYFPDAKKMFAPIFD